MPDWTKLTVQDWLAQRLSLENSRFWTDTERQDLSDKLARRYRPGGKRTWEVRRGSQMGQDGLMHPVYVVGTGELEVHTDDSEEKASAIARTLQGLDRAWNEEPVPPTPRR